MPAAALVATLVVAALHLGFMVLETFLWTRPTGRRVFGGGIKDFEATRVLAQNQGVYNGALAGVLAWAALAGDSAAAVALLIFVVVVGVFGAATAKPSIFFVQALPALVALGLIGLA